MKKTQIIELIKNIRETLVSYISIAVFVMLGVAIFTGVEWGGNSIMTNVEKLAVDEGKLHDMEVFFPYGFDDDDLEALSQVEGVDEIEGSRFSYQLFRFNGTSYYTVIHQLPEVIDDFVYVEGELPGKSDEIAVDRKWAEDIGVNIGDTITFADDNNGEIASLALLLNYDGDIDRFFDLSEEYDSRSDDPKGLAYLKTTTFRVTALVESSLYTYQTMGVCPENNISLNTNMYVSEPAWSSESEMGYTSVRIRNNSLRGISVVSDEYKELYEEFKTRLKPVLEELAQNRCTALHDNIDSIITETENDLKKAEKELKDAEKELKDAGIELEDGRTLLDDGKREIEDGKKELDDGEKELQTAAAELNRNEALLNQKYSELSEGYAKLKNSEDMLSDLTSQHDDLKQAATGLSNLESGYTGILSAAREMQGTYTDSEVLGFLNTSQLMTISGQIAGIADALSASMELGGADVSDLTTLVAGLTEEDLENGLTSLEAKETDIAAIILAVNIAEGQLSDAVSQLTFGISSGRAQLDQGKAQLSQARSQLESGWNSYYRGVSDVKQARKELDEAEITLVEKEKEYTDGLSEYEDGLTEYNDGLLEYEEGVEDFEKLKESLGEIEDYDPSITASFDNASLLLFSIMQSSCMNMRTILSVMFVFVGLLVCYSTVSRLVYDQIIRIGTKKALGLYQKEITLSYVGYSMSTAIIGCTLGILVGKIVAWAIQFILLGNTFPGKMTVCSDYSAVFFLWAIQLLMILFVTLVACRNILKQSAIKLLAGPEPPASKKRFYEKFKLWEKTSLLGKTIVNNCMNDRRRVFGTLIGIGSCCALIVMSMTVYLNMMQGFSYQKKELYGFDSIVYFDSDKPSAQKKISDILESNGFGYTEAAVDMINVDVASGDFLPTTVFAPNDREEFLKFTKVIPYENYGTDTENGTWMTASYVNIYGGGVPQNVGATDMQGNKVSYQVDGFYLNYSGHGELILDPMEYERVFQKDYRINGIIFNSGRTDLKDLESELLKVDGYINTQDYFENIDTSADMFKETAFAIVGVSLVLSVVMAFLVILNLLYMYVAEKRRELIILRINGYYVKDVKKYIYSDTIVLSVISIILGLILGSLVGNLMISFMESSMVLGNKTVNLWACLGGAGVTGILTLICSRRSLREVNNLKLTDINK